MILQFSRDQIMAFAQGGVMNIKSLTHWDICNSLKSGKTMEVVADDFRVSYSQVKQIKCRKCPDL